MDHLYILWTHSNKEAFMNMIAMYTYNSKKENWWKEVTLIIWGPSAKLVSEDTQVQIELFELKHAGVEILACKACSDSYNVSESLIKLGVDVKYMGMPLTNLLKSDCKVLTF